MTGTRPAPAAWALSVAIVGWLLAAIFLAIVALVAFTVLRGLWQFMRGDFEPESGGHGDGSSSAAGTAKP
jgi:hypothetical protein